ncbi:MAG: YdcF family protein [Alphaproteobacteria bacterium]|nr:YdcF family protein [Alphaproteobacteria bacterium]
MRWLVVAAVAAGLAWVGLAVALDAWGGAQVPDAHAALVAVCGCHVQPDGRPSACLEDRVRAGAALVVDGHAGRLLVTGGRGDGPVAEAVAAARLARDLGVADVVVEDRSTSTEENAVFGMALAPADRVIVVTDTFHLWRAERCFGVHAHVSGQPVVPRRPGQRIDGALREVAAVAYYLATRRCAGGEDA